jgi:hypothetical protein
MPISVDESSENLTGWPGGTMILNNLNGGTFGDSQCGFQTNVVRPPEKERGFGEL